MSQQYSPGTDLAAIGRRLIPVALAGAIVIVLAGTPLRAAAWAILAVALAYAVLYGHGSKLVDDINAVLRRGGVSL